jgi:hypothetical protein
MLWPGNLTSLARHDFVVADKKLRRAGIRAADYRNQAGDLLASDQPEYAAAWARQHCPERICALSSLARILKNEDSSRLHLFRNPLIQDIDFRDHLYPRFGHCRSGKDPLHLTGRYRSVCRFHSPDARDSLNLPAAKCFSERPVLARTFATSISVDGDCLLPTRIPA